MAGTHDVMLATLEWVDWYNTERLHSACKYIPPKEYEESYYKALESGKISRQFADIAASRLAGAIHLAIFEEVGNRPDMAKTHAGISLLAEQKGQRHRASD